MQAADFLKIKTKQADEIGKKHPISEGCTLNKRMVLSENEQVGKDG